MFKFICRRPLVCIALLCMMYWTVIYNVYASSYDNVYTPTVTFKAGDLLKLPNRKGTYILAMWGQRPVFYNGQKEWFQFEPIRNWQTVAVDITRQIPEGDYQLLEVMVEEGTDAYNLENWRWVREYKARVIRCDYFSAFYDQETCLRPVRRED